MAVFSGGPNSYADGAKSAAPRSVWNQVAHDAGSHGTSLLQRLIPGRKFPFPILEPHDDTRTDTWAKVHGLAKFADAHGVAFGRLMLGRRVGDKLQVVDVAEHRIREKARKLGAPADLESLFDEV